MNYSIKKAMGLTSIASSAASTLLASATILATSALADDPSVTITGVTQRWPWNNKLDIAYTVSGGQTRTSGVYCGIRFTFTANGQTYSIEGSSIGASAENGSNVATWTAPQGIVTTDGSMTATLFSTNVPSGDDYMVVDLASGNVAYEGLFATQEDSNARYNTAEYKTDKLVLRKVAAGGPYPTGDSVNYPSSVGDYANSSRTWTTDRDYYIGVFPVTQRQYQTIRGSNPSQYKSTQSGVPDNIPEHRPVEKVSWNDLRLAETAPDSQIPAVSSFTGTFFQRLNFRTGLYFDLPTEVMFEIAERAGTTTTFFWGNNAADGDAYAVHKGNTSLGNIEMAVGSRLPNGWGLYDMAGNLREMCLDDSAAADLAGLPDAFTPSSASAATRRLRGGGTRSETLTDTSKPNENARFRSSYRNMTIEPSNATSVLATFRVSLIAD